MDLAKSCPDLDLRTWPPAVWAGVAGGVAARAGAEVTCLDLSRQALQEQAVREADLIAFYVPMHTATRLATQLIEPVRRLNPRAHLCFYGLYAPVNEAYLRGLGVETILGGEFEERLAELSARLADQCAKRSGTAWHPRARPGADASTPEERFESVDLARPPQFHRAGPQRPAAARAIRARAAAGRRLRVAGYTEASRGCKHLCRHCPIVPVYNGVFRIVQREVVLEDIRRQVAPGAEHITFGDPDFFNGPAHALAIVEALHREFPQLSYDVTIKIEHLLQPRRASRASCAIPAACSSPRPSNRWTTPSSSGWTKATRAPIFSPSCARFRELGLVLQPTFVPFTPWTTLEGYRDLLDGDRRAGPDRKRRADPARHPPADSGGLAPAGAGRSARRWSASSIRRAGLSVEARRSAPGRARRARAGPGQPKATS